MYKILEKRQLAPQIFLMEIEAPRLASAALPGQFLIIRDDEKGERIPLTVSDSDPEKGTVTVVIQLIGRSSHKMVEQYGGKNVSSISKNTSYVLAGEKMGPEKKKKAESLGIPIISETEFYQMIGKE